MIEMYGIPNCDTVRKARKWLAAQGLDYRFHDLRQQGVDEAHLHRWVQAVGWERLLNRRGLTWRRLPEQERIGLDAAKAQALMLRMPTLIKRPVLEWRGGVHVGFSPEAYQTLFSQP